MGVELTDLPLQLLARDLAGRCGGLTVGTAELPELLGGALCAFHADGGVVIMLDLDWLARRRELDEAWAHELAHVIDQLDGRVTQPGSVRGERFANALGPLLLSHRPGTVNEAVALVGRYGLRSMDRDPARRRPDAVAAVALDPDTAQPTGQP